MKLISALKTDWFFLFLIITLAILIRSLNFTESLNFSSDQAKFSIKSLEILRGENESLVLIGPPISLQLEGREVYQGGVVYYFLALFLSFGSLDPVKSSYLFMLFSCLMAIPLYYGMKYLSNPDKAKLVTIFYCLLPIFINYTKFLWNPNFQLALLPLLFLCLGLYKKSPKTLWLFIAGIWFGLLLQFHYQLLIGLILIIGYLKFYLKTSFPKILLFLLGSAVGFLPILIFELRNNFSNLQTTIFYLQNFSKFQNSNSSGFFTNQHYFLSLLLITLVIIITYLKKPNIKTISTIGLGLLVLNLFLYFPKPDRGFGMAENWNYADELKAYEAINQEHIEGYNITNLGYDTLAHVQKYLHKKDNLDNKLTDYWEIQKMFVISPKSKDIFNDLTYEVQVVKPFKILKQWEINNNYVLYLLEKA